MGVQTVTYRPASCNRVKTELDTRYVACIRVCAGMRSRALPLSALPDFEDRLIFASIESFAEDLY
jgi:hypothetical protein